MSDQFGGGNPPDGCGEARNTNSDGSTHVTRYSPDFRRSFDIKPDGSITGDHIGPNSGIGSERVPFNSPYDRINPDH